MVKYFSLTPRPSDCPDCKGGRIGMDQCEKCAKTGRVFVVGSQIFPDTREGYDRAKDQLERSGMNTVFCG